MAKQLAGKLAPLLILRNDGFDSLVLVGGEMKARVFSVALGGCVLALLLGAAASYAQMPGASMRVNIPFEFNVRGRTLPAGHYEIKRIGDEPEGLEISDIRQSHAHAMFETEPVDSSRPARHGEVVFHRYGDQYFLSEIWSAGIQTGRELPVSKQERVVKREMAKNMAGQSEPETVALAIY